MTIKILSLYFLIPLISFAQDSNQKLSQTDVIYGSDDRYEVRDYPDEQFQLYASSVAGMVRTENLSLDSSSNYIDYQQKTLEEENPFFCPGVRFAKQKVLPTCTGFLVDKDIILTAGHCVDSRDKCSENYRWVFNYNSSSKKIPLNNIYKCERVITSKIIQKRKSLIKNIASALVSIDYALIIIKPENRGNPIERTPLEYRKSGRAIPYTPVLSIGHPLKLPMKITDNAYLDPITRLAENTADSFLYGFNRSITNLDNFVGSSGSPVININTGTVEGILLGGKPDTVQYSYGPYRSCQKINVTSDDPNNFQEEVLLTPSIPELKNLAKARNKASEFFYINQDI